MDKKYPDLVNTEANNELLPSQTVNIAKWHWDRNLIEGTTANKQYQKLIEEVVEIFACMNPNFTPKRIHKEVVDIVDRLYVCGRIKQGDLLELPDAIGDSDVVLINLAERHGHTKEHCVSVAYNAIKNRKGKMVHGIWTKEEDLKKE